MGAPSTRLRGVSRAVRIGAAALGPLAAALGILAILAIACGSSYDGAPDEADAGEDTSRARDTSVKDTAPKPDVDGDSPTTCDPAQPFTNVGPVAGKINGGTDDAFPTLTDDELTMYFQRSPLNGGSARFFVSVRPSLGADFGEPVEVTELNNGAFNSYPAVSPSGDVIFFTSAPTASAKSDLMMATRGAMGRFNPPTPVAALNTASDDEAFPSVFGRGEELWFGSNAGGGVFHLQRSVRLPAGTFTAPQPITEIRDPVAGEGTSASTRDGLAVYFSSSRDGGQGGLDVWLARRQARSAPFNFVAVVATASSSDNDAPAWVSADSCRLYFTSTRLGTLKVFVASRRP